MANKLDPTQGGCWFCSTDDETKGPWLFSMEFDCALHKSCLEEQIAKYDPDHEDLEVVIMAREFELPLPKAQPRNEAT